MNASLIQLPGGKTEFIAAQAPLPATLDEWYRLMELKNEHFQLENAGFCVKKLVFHVSSEAANISDKKGQYQARN